MFLLVNLNISPPLRLAGAVVCFSAGVCVCLCFRISLSVSKKTRFQDYHIPERAPAPRIRSSSANGNNFYNFMLLHLTAAKVFASNEMHDVSLGGSGRVGK